MDDLKLFISENKDSLVEENLREGDGERFIRRLEAEVDETEIRKIHFHTSVLGRRISVWRILAVPAAAVILMVFTLNVYIKYHSGSMLDDIYTSYRTQLMELSSEIVALTDDEEDAMMYSGVISDIDFEAIPMSEILPSELTEKEKAGILESYYAAKLDGIKKLRNTLAESK